MSVMYPVSVIIPTYNGEATIERAIRSCRGCEVIVVDDGSKDRTVDIAYSLGARIYIYNNNSGGPNRGRNTGAQLATQKYINFLDQDDELCEPGLIEAVGHARDGIACGPLKSYRGQTAYDLYWRTLAREYGNIPYLGSILLTRNLALNNRFRGKWLDYDWLLRITVLPVYVCQEQRVLRRRSDDSLSMNPEYRQDEYREAMRIYALEHDGNPTLCQRGRRRLASSYGRYFYVREKMEEARYWLSLFPSWKNTLYRITSHCLPLSRIVRRLFGVFG